jgi:hypothetical protein
MAKTIILKYPAKCADPRCGVSLAAGALAVWYGRGRVYGRGCHEDVRPAGERGRGRVTVSRCGDCGARGEATGHQACQYPGAGFGGRAGAGRGRGVCEDAPCCGCCGPGSGDPSSDPFAASLADSDRLGDDHGPGSY